MILILLIDLVVVISLIVASRRRLQDALPLFCFFLVVMPFESRFVVPGVFDISTERVALLTLLILFLVRPGRSSFRKIPLKRLIWLHIGWALCSTVYSLSVVTSTKQLIAQVLEYYLLYYIFLKTISEVRTVHRIVYAMAIAMGVCCIFGLFEAYGSWSILQLFPSNLWIRYDRADPLYIEWGRGLRIRSTFPHPILFGDALAMCIPLTLYLVSIWKKQWQRFVLWVSVVLMFWGLYKTSSRGPWIALGVSCVLLFVLVHNRVRKYVTVMALLSLTVVVSRPGIRQTIVGLYESTQDSTSPVGSSYEYRHALTDAVTSAVAKEPGRTILGYGLGTFRELGLEINFQHSVQRWYTCDNNWAAFLYETGYVGLLIIGMLLFKPLLMTLKSYQRLPRPEKYFSGVLFIVLGGFYFMLLSVAGYSWGQQGFMAWILISLSVVYPRVAMQDRQDAAASKTPLQMADLVPEPPVPVLQSLWDGTI
jgi:O-Antigen ligase